MIRLLMSFARVRLDVVFLRTLPVAPHSTGNMYRPSRFTRPMSFPFGKVMYASFGLKTTVQPFAHSWDTDSSECVSFSLW